MKKCILLALMVLATNGFAQALHSYDNIKKAVITGKTIHIAVHFSKCKAPDQELARSMSIGVYTPDAVAVVDNHMSASLHHFTLNNPAFPDKPVYEFVTYTFSDDDNLTLTGNVLDAVTYTPLSDKFSVTCKLGWGVTVYV